MIEIPNARVLRFTYDEIERWIKPGWKSKAEPCEDFFYDYLLAEVVEDGWHIDYTLNDEMRHYYFVILSDKAWSVHSRVRVVEEVVIDDEKA